MHYLQLQLRLVPLGLLFCSACVHLFMIHCSENKDQTDCLLQAVVVVRLLIRRRRRIKEELILATGPFLSSQYSQMS
jgi:hypothetical protein